MRIDLRTYDIQISLLLPDMPVSPTPGFPIFDPTSIFLASGRLFVVATMRRHPDFSSTIQDHVETRVFEVKSGLTKSMRMRRRRRKGED